MGLSKADEDLLKKKLGGTYGGPSISFEGDEFVMYEWGDGPVSMDIRARGKTFAELLQNMKVPGGLLEGKKVTWRDPHKSRRGDVLEVEGHSTVCVGVHFRKGGGAGMGEYPNSWTATFASGLVLDYDAWVNKGAQWTVSETPFGGD